MSQSLLYFDIETVEDESRSELWQAKKDETLSSGKEFFPALIPEFCKIVALGWAIDEEQPKSLVTGIKKETKDGNLIDVTEQVILDTFWKLVSTNTPTLIGFNMFNFDLPVIFIRSAILSVKPKRLIDRKSWSKECIDLLETRRYTNGGGRLKDLARYFGFDIPAQDVSGSDVENLYRDDPIQLSKYVESDIIVTRQLYHFYKGYFVA